MGYYGNRWEGAGWEVLFRGAFGILAVALIIAGAVWLSRSARDIPERDHRSSGLDVLDERYARGARGGE